MNRVCNKKKVEVLCVESDFSCETGWLIWSKVCGMGEITLSDEMKNLNENFPLGLNF